jgi:leucyl-tRNA synthetase
MSKDSNNSSYNPSEIEPKWRDFWESEGVNQVSLESASRPYFNLMMFPYPSAEGLHVGNMYAFTGSDIWGRYRRMKGFSVFEPIGLDGFGIHSENYALKVGKHPLKQAEISEANFYRQLKMIGNQFSWSNKVETYDPEYYRWTQWIFIKMFKAGLAYRDKAPVNWCPSCKTVLADEQVIDGECERCETLVEERELEQWFFKITKYAERLLGNLSKIDWSLKVKIAQRNWIGRKEGIDISYDVVGGNGKKVGLQVSCFTTRPDTNFGATFVVLSPENPVLKDLKKYIKDKVWGEIASYIKKSKKMGKKERIDQGREKTGVFTGLYCINQLTAKKMPLWVSDFVLMDVGSGAVVGVPGHDVRDFEFAKKFGLDIVRVVVGPDGDKSSIDSVLQVQEEEGVMINSGFLNGMDIKKAVKVMMDYIEKKGWGKRKVHYRLRDWLISRQRYWGPPIPMVNCSKCGWQPVSEKNLPVLLPEVEDWQPKGEGKGPLAEVESFVRTKCPKCGGEARRETDVSDTFLDSSWYFLRYPSKGKKDAAWDKKLTSKWLPVSMYIGGAEHSVLHLLYSRFLTMVFHDLGFLSFEEPFSKFRAHGLIIKDGDKMSKSKGNIVNPDEYIARFGADSLRCYLMFLGPLSSGGDFSDTGMKGMFKFLKRVYSLVLEKIESASDRLGKEEEYMLSKTVKDVETGLKRLKYNTSLAFIMEYVNFLKGKKVVCKKSLETLVLLLCPFAPHLAEELWEVLGGKPSVHDQAWPKFNESVLQKEEVEIMVQVNGRLRDRLKISSSLAEFKNDKVKNEVLEEIKALPKIKTYLKDKEIKKSIFVKGKLVNLVLE